MEYDLEMLENAVRLFAQTLKRPQRWAVVTERAKVRLDRPAAVILQTLVLSGERPCRVQELAVQLGIEPPSVTRKTQELERAGYLRRIPNANDRRATDLRITPRGRNVAGRLWQAQRSILAEALQHWPAAERRQFVKLFARFSDDLVRTSVPTRSTKPHRRATHAAAAHGVARG